MSRFSDGHGRTCKTDFWLTIPLSFKQILNLCFDMANIYCTSNGSCLTFVTTATNFFVTVDFEVWNSYGMMTNDLIWIDTLSSFIGDSSVTKLSFIWSEYWLILTKPFSNLRQWAEKIPGKGGVLSIIVYSIRIHFLCCNIENFNDRNISRRFEERRVVSYDSFSLDNFSSCQLLDCPTNSVNRTFPCEDAKNAMLFQYCIRFAIRIKLQLCNGF